MRKAIIGLVFVLALAALVGGGVLAHAKPVEKTNAATESTSQKQCKENTSPKLEGKVIAKLGDPRKDPGVAAQKSAKPDVSPVSSDVQPTPFNEQTERTSLYPHAHKDTKEPGCQFSSAELQAGGQ